MRQQLVTLSRLATAVGASYHIAQGWGIPPVIVDPPRYSPRDAIDWLVAKGKIAPDWAIIALTNLGVVDD